ncbi:MULTISPECIES: LysR family transcriptional regulator [Streptomyces]|uniref:Transcriptional regulator n=1 Tax=Streptomyces sviceus (strain ATCC 29083 / DSM 924 / JCM 4929 / NBRC 13980 / NCIMB 11184 / NRRL 5439 / UC 5370) TaxID=463191 RepID=B5HUZ1_STRX2|nr:MULTISPECIES: LysR family transcriptional regulator [Streptomyces]EDY56646.1 transcriptional regulator [Streptomyces sviceus ATCC 29083]MYT10774.1 LysR family transcriptional regulator [Streptomyces sp. SID5470]
MAHDLETALLRAFVSSVRSGSISRAAAALGHSQPALSNQLRRLERTVGQRLLHRGTTGVSLTKSGEIFLPYAERILALSAQGLAAAGPVVTGHCGVGLMEDFVTPSLVEALSDFSGLHPGAKLELVTGSGPLMKQSLAEGRIQLALCDPFYLAEAPRWTARLPLAWSAARTLDLRQDPLPLVLFSQPCRWRIPVFDALEAAGIRWDVVFESTALGAVQAAARAGLGATALLPANVEPGTATDELPALPEVEIALTRHTGTDGDPLLDAVENLLRRLTDLTAATG